MSIELGLKQIYPSWLVYDTAFLTADKMKGYSSGSQYLHSINSTNKVVSS